MISNFTQALSFPFMQKALVAGLLISLCAALLGVSLVLKRYSMIGDGLSHVGFGALAIASALNWQPMSVALPVVVLSAFLLLRISENSKIQSDAAIGLISSGALAVGVMITSIKGTNNDLNSYLFGSILALNDIDVLVAVILSIFVLILFVFFYYRIFAVTFDQSFARATGVNAGILNALIAMMTAVTIVLGMRMMGTLLISSLIIFPAMTSMRVCRSFLAVTVVSAAISVLCYGAGLFFSFSYSTPTGASVVSVNVILFCVVSMVMFLINFIGRIERQA